MITIKNTREIEVMKEGGARLAWVFGRVLKKIKPGVKLQKLDELAEALIKKQGGFPSFKIVKGYSWATCININSGVVHGIPNDYQIEEKDVVSLDMGMLYGGFHTDMARTLCVRIQNSKLAPLAKPLATHGKTQNLEFLEAGKSALNKAIEVAKPGNRVGHISAAIEKEIKKAGFSPIEALTGHGVGQNLHEEPQVPCFVREEIDQSPLLKPGMSLAIEVIYAQGRPDLVLKNDGWTVETADGSLAGLFEDTVVITKKNPIILTPLEVKLEV